MEQRPHLLRRRNSRPLSSRDKERVKAALAYLDYPGPYTFRDGLGTRSVFTTKVDPQSGKTIGVLEIGSDILPGTDTLNPNSRLGLLGAVAHEVTHWWRHAQGTEWEPGDVDEMATSLEAVSRFQRKLQKDDVVQLAEDALYRLEEYHRTLQEGSHGNQRES